MKRLQDFVRFNNADLAKKYASKKIPITTLFEAYFDGDVDITDVKEFIKHRHDFVNFHLVPDHFKWALTNFLPEAVIHSQAQDKRIVREHYDRGNDFFSWFLGDRMVYTSGFYTKDDQTLEQAQDNKMDLVCKKLQLKPGDKLLDIGCGWGTLVRYAAKHYGVDATGVTISENQTEWAMGKIKEDGLEGTCRVLCKDYRDIEQTKYDKIVSLEMVEHVGVKNLDNYFNQVNDLLKDDGLFLLQWTGLRHGGLKLLGEDLVWIMFMGKYIFPGADASLPCSPMLKYMEKAGFEFHSVENITIHYSRTIDQWHQNWLENKDEVLKAYGERWFRLWNFFLAWSSKLGELGTGGCFQVLMNKNINAFDRTRFIGEDATSLGDRTKLRSEAA